MFRKKWPWVIGVLVIAAIAGGVYSRSRQEKGTLVTAENIQHRDLEALVSASGIIILHLLDFMQQLTTFRAAGPTFSDRAAALARFGKLFFGKLWDVYARQVQTSAPF